MTGLEELRKTHEAGQRQLCEAIQVGVLALTSLEHRISALRAALLSIIRCGSSLPVCLSNFISILRAVLLTTFMTTLQGGPESPGHCISALRAALLSIIRCAARFTHACDAPSQHFQGDPALDIYDHSGWDPESLEHRIRALRAGPALHCVVRLKTPCTGPE